MQQLILFLSSYFLDFQNFRVLITIVHFFIKCGGYFQFLLLIENLQRTLWAETDVWWSYIQPSDFPERQHRKLAFVAVVCFDGRQFRRKFTTVEDCLKTTRTMFSLRRLMTGFSYVLCRLIGTVFCFKSLRELLTENRGRFSVFASDLHRRCSKLGRNYLHNLTKRQSYTFILRE